ncbi:MAG: flagellar hook-length control protein FliK [Paenisporosarcina sp.]
MQVVASPINSMQLGSVKSLGTSNNSLSATNVSLSSFGAVFGQLTLSKEIATKPETEKPVLGEVSPILNATTLEELMSVLDIPIEGMNLDGQLTLEDVANFLQLDVEELKKTIQQLLGEEKTGEEMWEMLSLIENQSPMFMKSIMESLAGEGEITGQQAASVLKFLKAVELAAPKTDLVLKQEVQVFSLKEMLSSISNQVEKMVSTDKKVNPLDMKKRSQLVNINNVTETATTATTATTDATATKAITITTTTATTVIDNNENLIQSPRLVNTTQTLETQQVSSGPIVTQVKTETVSITLPTQTPAQSEAFTKEFASLLNRSQFGQAGGMTKMLIKMYPEHLGTIRVELIQKDGVMTARLLANTALGKEMLDSQLHQLKSAFANANVQVDRLDVTQALQDSNKNDKQQQFSQSFKQQQQQQQQEQSEYEETPEQASFREFLMELEA